MERKTSDASYVYADDFYLEIIDPNNTEELNFIYLRILKF
jgi:hypothetical protein